MKVTEHLKILKSISITISEKIPPEADSRNAVNPRVVNTNKDLRITIDIVLFRLRRIAANITTILASPGFAPTGSGNAVIISI